MAILTSAALTRKAQKNLHTKSDRELGNHYKLLAVPFTCSSYVQLRTYKRDESAHCSAVFYTNSLSFFKVWYVIQIFPFQVGTEYLTTLRN
jgi:hypothetical protein